MGATCLTPTVSRCNGRSRKSGDTVRVRFNAPAAGTYYIAIKFNAQNLSGEPAPNPVTTVHYDFMTTGVPESISWARSRQILEAKPSHKCCSHAPACRERCEGGWGVMHLRMQHVRDGAQRRRYSACGFMRKLLVN